MTVSGGGAMELSEMIQIVEDKAKDIADQEILKYIKDFPEITLTDEAKEATRVRALSQLTLQLSKFKFHDGEEPDAQFNSWFEANEESDLRKACRHCLDDEANKIRQSANKNLSSLDAYLKRHLGDIHQVD